MQENRVGKVRSFVEGSVSRAIDFVSYFDIESMSGGKGIFF